jgi:hypothetical protein
MALGGSRNQLLNLFKYGHFRILVSNLSIASD